jgi:hypothetical protein
MPKAYAGTYGTNGFKLNFSDNSTAAALGTDTSGQGNTWTVNNLSVTAGAGNDSLIDVPVNGSEVDTGAGGQVRGNYCTLNPLDKASAVALANGNLEATITTADHMGRATIAIPSSDKWYFEFSPTVIFGTRSPSVGVASGSLSTTASNGYKDALAWTLSCASGNKQNSGAETSYGSAFSANDIGMCAVDVANGKIWWGRNGTWIASGDPAAGTNAAFTNVSGTVFPAVFGPDGSVNCTCVFNFGARSFAYTAPSGFKALCTANLPAPVVTKPSTVMDVLTWSGSGGARSFTGLGFSPDLVWGKQRNGSNAHQIYDIVRGAGNNKDLASDYTAAEGSGTTGASAYGYLSSFDSTGFSVANGTDGTFGAGYWNLSGRTYAAWTWDAGSSTVTNTQGSISSQVRANASAGFSVVTFSMLSGTYTVGHGLNVAPSLLITKGRTFTSNWWVYHASLGSSQYLGLNSTAAASSLSWGGSPTSSVFTANNNFFSNGQDYVVYAFAPVAGYSSMSTWTGNGSSDGPMVWTGFRPRWLLFKETGGTGSWGLIDSARSTYNVTSHELYANLSDAEYAVSSFDFLSNGFKLRTSSTAYNGSGKTFIFAAFAESPFQYARAR